MAKENPANSRLSVDSGPFVFHYLIHDGICYLTLTDRCSFHPCSMPLRQSNAPSCCGLLHPCMQVAPMERRFHAVDGLLWFVILQSGSSYLKGGSFCFRSYPKKLAYQYLEELQSEFTSLYGTQIQNATRPYAFIKFGARNCLPYGCMSQERNIIDALCSTVGAMGSFSMHNGMCGAAWWPCTIIVQLWQGDSGCICPFGKGPLPM